MDLTIIIPTKLAHDKTMKCLNSFIKFTKNIDFEIILVVNKDYDNITKKTEVTKIKKLSEPKIKTIWPKTDLGIAGAINHGVKLSKGKYIFITNDDIELKEPWFDKYKSVFEKYPCIGSIGFKGNTTGFRSSGNLIKRNDDVIDLINQIKPYPNCQKIFQNEKHLNYIKSKNPYSIKKYPKKIAKYHERYWPYIAEVGFHHTCAIFTTRIIFDKVGGFDEIYWPANGEDRFFGYTLLAHGYRNIRIPLRHIHYGDEFGFAKSGGATNNLLKKRKIRKNVVIVRAKIKPYDERIREKYKKIIPLINRNKCSLSNICRK